MKTLITFLGLVLSFTNILAQKDTNGEKKTCDEYMRSSKYIFEGKVISSKYVTIKTGEYTYVNYNAYLMQVKKVIKGNIQKGTITILEGASGYTYKGPDHSESSHRGADDPGGIPEEGIYFSEELGNVQDSNFTNTKRKY